MNASSNTTYFAAAHAASADAAEWGRLALQCVARLGPGAERAHLGFVYVTDLLAPRLAEIVALLRQATGIKAWVGSVGMGISASGVEYFDQPALAVMTAALPADSFRLLPNLCENLDEMGEARSWLRAHAERAGPLGAPMLGVVHADPRNERLPQLVNDLAGEVGFLVGGLASARGEMDQIAGTVCRGGVSGARLAGGGRTRGNRRPVAVRAA
jgi:small ligand-binding sensory domain FIST